MSAHGIRRLCLGALPAVLAGGALAACGSGSSSTATRAKTATTPLGATVPAAARAQQAALHRQVTAALHTHSDARYGGLPSYLPKPKIPTQRVVTARLAHPKLAIEGDTVEIVLPHACARATIVGPYVPDKDQGTFQNTANVSFDATFASVRGTVPLAASMFTISDELGAVHHPKITVRHGGRLPVRLPRGKPITLVLRTTLPIGNGRVRYRPAGRHAVASWDFDSETD